MSIEEATIESERLVLRPLSRTDVPALAALGADDVFAMVPEIATPFDASAWVEHKLESEVPPICHVVMLRDTYQQIGFCQVQFEVSKSDHELSVGYWFGRDYWGCGYATETLQAVLGYLRDKGRPRPLFAKVAPDNLASRKVLEKCGFVVQFTGEVPDRGNALLRYMWIQQVAG